MRMLITTDGSPRSFGVVAHAERLATVLGLEPSILQVLGRDESRAEAASRIQEELRRLGLKVPIEFRTRDGGDVALRIVSASAELSAGMLAMDCRGTGVLRRAVLGSVALEVLRTATTPLLLTGLAAEPPVPRAETHLLMTTDGSPASRAVFLQLAPLIEGRPIRVTLLRLYVPRLGDDGPVVELARCRSDLERCKELLPPETPVGVRAEVLPEFETVAHGIARLAAACDADAIAMSTHGHGALRHIVLGSVALATLEQAPMPVLLARAV